MCDSDSSLYSLSASQCSVAKLLCYLSIYARFSDQIQTVRRGYLLTAEIAEREGVALFGKAALSGNVLDLTVGVPKWIVADYRACIGRYLDANRFGKRFLMGVVVK